MTDERQFRLKTGDLLLSSCFFIGLAVAFPFVVFWLDLTPQSDVGRYARFVAAAWPVLSALMGGMGLYVLSVWMRSPIVVDRTGIKNVSSIRYPWIAWDSVVGVRCSPLGEMLPTLRFELTRGDLATMRIGLVADREGLIRAIEDLGGYEVVGSGG